MNLGDSLSHRPIRSFVIRSGRLTVSQKKAIERHWQDWVVDYQGQQLDSRSVYGNDNPLVVEIGFGMGDSLLQMAAADPASNFLGIEVHRPGIGKLLQGIVDLKLQNLKVVCHDAREVMGQAFLPSSLVRIQIFFPDPWPKKKHHKRRIVQPDLAGLMAERLVPGGRLHLATDWLPYAEHMMAVLSSIETLENAAGEGRFWDNPDRPQTKFERRSLRLGHGVRDLLFTRRQHWS